MIQPLDIITLEGTPWSVSNWIIQWASMSKETHCIVVRESNGRIFDPTVGGVLDSHLKEYNKRTCNLLRYKDSFDSDRLMEWAVKKQSQSKGYDYLAWLGFALRWKALEDEDKWYCSEFPYWMFQDNGYKLTHEDLVFVFPSDLTHNMCFNIEFHGKVEKLLEGGLT
ncbi:MAG: hypothetical protein ABIG95_02750 [Candidatus Woesearchaeota archaeon]